MGLLSAEPQSAHGKVQLPQVYGPPAVCVEKIEDFMDLQGSSLQMTLSIDSARLRVFGESE